MVTLYRGPGWKISVYGREHGVQHFHVEGVDFRCSVSMASFEVVVGTVPLVLALVALTVGRMPADEIAHPLDVVERVDTRP